MQTFLPYTSYKESAKCLDRMRLGKQRVEALQLLNTFKSDYSKKGWLNHPARKMWQNNVLSLAAYGVIVCNEWISRGYKDTCKQKIIDTVSDIFEHQFFESEIIKFGLSDCPKWLNESFTESHRSNLLRKNKEWYSQFNWKVSNNLKYIWPAL